MLGKYFQFYSGGLFLPLQKERYVAPLASAPPGAGLRGLAKSGQGLQHWPKSAFRRIFFK